MEQVFSKQSCLVGTKQKTEVIEVLDDSPADDRDGGGLEVDVKGSLKTPPSLSDVTDGDPKPYACVCDTQKSK